MIGAPKEVDIDTSETSSYQSSKGKEKAQPEENTDIKELQAELKEIEEAKGENGTDAKPAEGVKNEPK